MDHIFLFCVSGNFWLDARYCKLYLVGCWVFLCSCKYWTLFQDIANLLGNCLTPSGLGLRTARWNRVVLIMGLLFSTTEATLSWVVFSVNCESCSFAVCLVGEDTILNPECSLSAFWVFFFPFWPQMVCSYECPKFSGNIVQRSGVLLSSFLHDTDLQLHVSWPPSGVLSAQLSPLPTTQIPVFVLFSGTPLRWKVEGTMGSMSHFSYVRDQIPHFLMISCLEHHCFVYFGKFLIFLRVRVNCSFLYLGWEQKFSFFFFSEFFNIRVKL